MYVEGVEGVKYFTEQKIKGFVEGVESAHETGKISPKGLIKKIQIPTNT